MRIIPSNNENSLWTCRWTKESDIGRPPNYPPPRQAQAVEVGNLKAPIFPENFCGQSHHFSSPHHSLKIFRLAGENPRSVAFASHSNKRHPIRKNFILQQDPIQILHGKSRLKRRHSKIKGDNITCCSRFRELQPSPTLLYESQIVLPTALFQRLEPFEETSRFFRPSDDTTEAFVVNGPLIDFAIRSTWA